MATIQEENLPKQLSDITGTDFLRIVLSGGGSKDIQKSLLTWSMSQVVDLVSTLATKASKEDTAALKGFLAYVKSDGDLGGSGYSLSDVTALTIDNIKNGIALASTPFSVGEVGTVYGVIAVGNIPIGENATGATPTASVQIVLSSNGLFYRVFSVDWGEYAYVGGSFDVRGYARADLITLMDDDKLTPGTPYMIIDHGGDLGMILTAATSSELFADGMRLTLIPALVGAGSFGGKTWIGEWTTHLQNIDVNQFDYATYMGRVWENQTGNIGTASGWDLDAVNWTLIDYTDDVAYKVEVHGIRYDIRNDGVSTSGWIAKESDNRGNEFGIEFDDLSGFRTEFCLWGTPSVYGNKLKSVRNCVVGSTTPIYGNVGHGDIYDITHFDVHENQLTADSNNIRNCFATALTKGQIYKNVLVNDADLQYLAANSNVHYNTICSDVKGDSGAYCTATVTNSYIGTEVVKDNVVLAIDKSTILGHVDGNANVAFDFCEMEAGSAVQDNTLAWLYNCKINTNAILSNKDMGVYKLINSTIDTEDSASETYTADKYIRQDLIPLSDDAITGGSSANKFKNWFTKILSTFTIDSLLEDLLIKTGAGKTLKLDTPVWDDINVPISSGPQPASNAPTWAAFSANTNSYTFAIDNYKDMGTIEIPHRYKEGTNLEVHLHLATNGLNNATARKVKYTIFYTYGLPDNGSNQFIAESSLTAELTIPANQADKSVYYLSMGTITGTNIKIGTQLKLRVKRIAGTGTEPINDPFLGQVGVHYEIDTMGSRTISAK